MVIYRGSRYVAALAYISERVLAACGAPCYGRGYLGRMAKILSHCLITVAYYSIVIFSLFPYVVRVKSHLRVQYGTRGKTRGNLSPRAISLNRASCSCKGDTGHVFLMLRPRFL